MPYLMSFEDEWPFVIFALSVPILASIVVFCGVGKGKVTATLTGFWSFHCPIMRNDLNASSALQTWVYVASMRSHISC